VKKKRKKKLQKKIRSRVPEPTRRFDRRFHHGISFSIDTGVLKMSMEKLRDWLRTKYIGYETLSSTDAINRLCDDHERLEKIIKEQGYEEEEIHPLRNKRSKGRKLRRIRRPNDTGATIDRSTTTGKSGAPKRRIQKIKRRS